MWCVECFYILFHKLCLLAHEVICSGVPIDHLCSHFIRIRSGPVINIAGPLIRTPIVYVMNNCIYVAGLIQAGCFIPQGGV